MEPKTYFDVAGQIVAKHPVDVVKLEMRAHGSAAAGCFWQVHDFAPRYNVAVPAEGAVPVKSWPCYAGVMDYKDFTGAELHMENGLYLCISTTEATKTLGTGNNKFAMLQAELVEDDALASATGVENTGATLEVWAESAGPKRLVRILAENSDIQTRYLQLFPYDSPQVGDVPLMVWALANSAAEVDLRFGDGLWVHQLPGSGGQVGCTLMVSSARRTYASVGVVSGMDLYAEYI